MRPRRVGTFVVGTVMTLGAAALVTALVPASFRYEPAPLVLALRASAALPHQPGPARPTSVILKNVRVVGPGGAGEPTSVRVESGRIVRLGADVGSDLPTRDGAGAFVMPGLIDAHVHLSMAPGAAIRMDDAATSLELRRAHLRAYVASGVTTILDPAVDAEVARHISQALAGGEPGPRYLHLGPPLVVDGGYVADLFPIPVSDAASVARHLDLLKAAGAAGAKLPIEPGVIQPVWNTPSDALLDTMRIQAAAHGLPLYVHAMTEDAYGRGLPLKPHAFVHAPDAASDALVSAVAASGAYVVSTAALWDVHKLLLNAPALDEPHVRRVVPPVERAGLLDAAQVHRVNTGLVGEVMPLLAGRWADVAAWVQGTGVGRAVLDAGMAVRLGRCTDGLLRMQRAGVPVVLGSDSGNWPVFPYYLHGPTTLREVDVLLKGGFTSREVLAAATTVPARMLGLDAEVGRVEVGMRADLVVTEVDPSLDLHGALRSIRWVVRDGVTDTPDGWMGQAATQQ